METAVQHDHRIACAGDLVIHLHAVDFDAVAFGRLLGERSAGCEERCRGQGHTHITRLFHAFLISPCQNPVLWRGPNFGGWGRSLLGKEDLGGALAASPKNGADFAERAARTRHKA